MPPPRYTRITDRARGAAPVVCARALSQPDSVRPTAPSAPTRRKSRRDTPSQRRCRLPKNISNMRSPPNNSHHKVTKEHKDLSQRTEQQLPHREPRQCNGDEDITEQQKQTNGYPGEFPRNAKPVRLDPKERPDARDTYCQASAGCRPCRREGQEQHAYLKRRRRGPTRAVQRKIPPGRSNHCQV